MGLFLDTARAVITSLKERANQLAATALLEEALRVINSVAAPHWRASSISELPEMIRELARDRDDFKTMSIAYRKQLADVEDKLRELEDELRNGECPCCHMTRAEWAETPDPWVEGET